MQGRNQSKIMRNRLRSGVAAVVMGGAASLMAAPANAQGAVEWSGPWASIGVGAVIMNTDTQVSGFRDERTNIDIACPERFDDQIVESCGVGLLDPGESISASILPLVQQQLLKFDGLSDPGVVGVLSAGWDLRFMESNFLIGGFFDYHFYNVSAEFKSQVWAEGGPPSFSIDGDPDCGPECQFEIGQELNVSSDLAVGIIGGVIGALVANDLRDEHIEIDGKIEQDYAIAAGGRIGYIWNEELLTYFGAAWTRTSINGHINVNIADPLCGPGSLCDELNSPTNIRLDLDQEVDGYKLLIGGEYALGNALGGGWFVRGQAEYADYDGLSDAISGTQKQNILKIGPNCSPVGSTGFQECNNPSVDIARQINEQATAQIDKEDFSFHAALVYKLGLSPN
jgi:hypothetical protein